MSAHLHPSLNIRSQHIPCKEQINKHEIQNCHVGFYTISVNVILQQNLLLVLCMVASIHALIPCWYAFNANKTAKCNTLDPDKHEQTSSPESCNVEIRDTTLLSTHWIHMILLCVSYFTNDTPLLEDLASVIFTFGQPTLFERTVPANRISNFSNIRMNSRGLEYRLSMNRWHMSSGSLSKFAWTIALATAFCVVGNPCNFCGILIFPAFFQWYTS